MVSLTCGFVDQGGRVSTVPTYSRSGLFGCGNTDRLASINEFQYGTISAAVGT